jgi:hypothetical protein
MASGLLARVMSVVLGVGRGVFGERARPNAGAQTCLRVGQAARLRQRNRPSITLPRLKSSVATEVDAKAVVARLEDGVLKLTLPKREGAGSRTITVQ